MKILTISSGIAALLLCLAHTAQSFVVSPQVKPIGSTTSLNLLSDQQVWEQTALADNGFAVRPGRSGMDYYPRYSPAAGSLTYNGGYNNNNYGYYNNDYYGYGGGLGRTLGYNDYYYNGYDNGYYGGYGGGTSTVQGHTRRTWSTSHSDSSNVQLESDGRPMHANVEVWQGAGGHSPAKMRLYSEDGYMRPWNAGFANTPRGGYTSSVTVQNEAPVAFPMRATVGNTNYNSRNYGGYGMGGAGQYIGSSRRSQVTIDGSGALRTFSFGPNTHSVVVEIWSDGMPFWADVEMWQGPNSVKQTAEVYSDSGSDRPWSAVIPTPGMSGTICIRNVGPMEFPFKVCVEPMMY